MIIGVSGPIDLKLLDWDVEDSTFPVTNAFPLTSHFINALLKRGYKVIGYTSSGEIDEPRVIQSGNLTICISRHKSQPGRRFFRFEVEELRKMILDYPADIISAFWTYEYAWAPLKTSIPTIVNLHDVAHKILLKQPDLFRLVRWAINCIVVRQAKHLVANSAYTYSMLSPSTSRKAKTINNFYTESLATIDLPKESNYIVTAIQGFTKRKNVHTALHAFSKLRAQFPALEYHLVGVDMEEGGPAQAYAKNHNIDNGVKYIGPLPFDEVARHIAGARAMLHPSMEESFGMSVLEAMVTGTPVVGGAKSGFVPHLLNFGEAGLLCDIMSPDGMAGSVARLLSDETYRQGIIDSAKTFARENFSEEVIISQHLAYLSEVLGKPLYATAPVTTKLSKAPHLSKTLGA